AACIHEEVVHPDVEFELLLPVHVPGRRGIPPDRQLPPDSTHEAGEPGQQDAERAVDPPRVLRARHVRPAPSLSTSRTTPRSGPATCLFRLRRPTTRAPLGAR